MKATKRVLRARRGADGHPEEIEVLPMQTGLCADDARIRAEAGHILDAVVTRLELFQKEHKLTGVVRVAVSLGAVTTMTLDEAEAFWDATEAMQAIAQGAPPSIYPPGFYQHRLYVALAPGKRVLNKHTTILESDGGTFCLVPIGEARSIVYHGGVVPLDGETSRWLEVPLSDEAAALIEARTAQNFVNDALEQTRRLLRTAFGIEVLS